MIKKTQSYYMVIPAEVWDAELTARAMILYGHISVLVNKKKYCYANNGYFEKVMKSSPSSIARSMKELEDAGLIYRQIIYKEGSKEIEERKIFLTTGIVTGDNRPIVTDDYTGIVTDDLDNNTSNNNTSNNNIDDVKGKIFFKIVDHYPPNRIGNRQHGLKKFKQLDIEQCKLAAKNLNRYLDLAGGYVKSLQNYIQEECYTERWLTAESKNKTQKHSIKNDTKTISSDF